MINVNISYFIFLALPILSKLIYEDPYKGLEDKIPMTEKEREESLNKFFEEWGNYMMDFNPSDMFAFEIPAGSKKTLFQKVEQAPVLFRAAYSTSVEDSYKMRTILTDPEGNIIFLREHAREAIIRLYLNMTGTYTLTFQNRNVKN